MGITNQHRRLKRLERAAKKPQEIVVAIDGVDDSNEVLDRLVASGTIAEHQRADVRFFVRSVVEPIWDMSTNGSAKLIGRRNVHTGEIEKVED